MLKIDDSSSNIENIQIKSLFLFNFLLKYYQKSGVKLLLYS
jgi:hypothetical protein